MNPFAESIAKSRSEPRVSLELKRIVQDWERELAAAASACRCEYRTVRPVPEDTGREG